MGAGKKPVAKPFALVNGGGAQEPTDLSGPPSDLPDDQQAFWREHAPLAIERSTLTPATVPAFRLLCELNAKRVMVGGMVDKGALGGLRVFMQLCKQVETLMARFCLAPFGKAVDGSGRKKTAENPFAAFPSKVAK